MQITVHHYDAFSTTPGQGNPAGIVFAAEQFSAGQMKQIAAAVGFNETTFVLPPENGAVRLRYFTPGHEMDLCGHATIATFTALAEREELSPGTYQLDVKAGLLPIFVSQNEANETAVTMQQNPAQFIPFNGDQTAVAQAIGLENEDLDPDLPILYGSTGIWTLIVPVRGLAAMQRMQPQNADFPSVLTQNDHASIHPICLETFDAAADYHGRHFSSPFSGTVEDPVTGTASGVMGAYYARFIQPGQQQYSLTVEQGQEAGYNGRLQVYVQVVGGEYQVSITGTAVFVRTFTVEI
jgi:trans-2,3-dihydro-3-hydroxyanthranilate isomerase